MNKLRPNLTVALLLAFPAALFSAPIGYSIASSDNSLYRIDLANGMATNLGAIDTDAVLGGIAASPSSLYAVSTSNNGSLPSQLYNVTTPPGVLVGDTGPRFGNTTGAAYLPSDGAIYDLQGMPSLSPGVTQSALYKIDIGTGGSTLLGTSPLYANGITAAPGGGYATDFYQLGVLYRLTSLDPYSLTLIGSFGLGIGGTGFNSGAAFDASTGTLYALREDGAIFTIATDGANAGTATFNMFVTDSSTDQRVASSLEGLAVFSGGANAAVPEPATLFLLLPGMAMLAFFLRKRLRTR